MLGTISAGRLCRRACFEFVAQTSSTHRLKEDLEPLLTLPTPHAHSCLSTDPVQNATWEAAAPAEPRGGPGREGLGDPSPRQLEAEPPDHSASLRKPPRESETDQRAQADRRWRPAGVSRPSSSGGAVMETMEVAGGFSFWNLSKPDLPVVPYNIHSKYINHCPLKRSFRTCMPDTYGQCLCAGSGPSSFPLSESKVGGRCPSPSPESSLGRTRRLVGWTAEENREEQKEENSVRGGQVCVGIGSQGYDPSLDGVRIPRSSSIMLLLGRVIGLGLLVPSPYWMVQAGPPSSLVS